MLCFEVLGYVKISSIVLTLSRLWNCPTYQRNHKNKNLTGSKLLNNKNLEDIFVGCTDILGISEIRTEAKMIYIGVGTDPFKQCGKGGWEEDGARLSRRDRATGGPGARYLPWAAVLWVIGSHVAFIKLVSCCSREEPPRPHVWGALAYWITHFKRKSSSLGLRGVRFGCSAHPLGGVWRVSNHLAIRSALWFLLSLEEMVTLFTQSKDVQSVYCPSCHMTVFAAGS